MDAQRITEEMVVRDIVVTYPGVRERLEDLGIDYCCGGRHTLKEAAAEKGVDMAKVLAGLNKALATPPKAKDAPKDWSVTNLTELADHIQTRHHTFMKEQMPRLEDALAKVLRAHAASHGALLRSLREVFAGLKAEIDAHLMKEEMILFPAIRRMKEKGSTGGMLGGPIGQMEFEHENAGRALARMRELTHNYELPPDACPTFAALYDGLRAVEADLHEHIHLENNVLFPRALSYAPGADVRGSDLNGSPPH